MEEMEISEEAGVLGCRRNDVRVIEELLMVGIERL